MGSKCFPWSIRLMLGSEERPIVTYCDTFWQDWDMAEVREASHLFWSVVLIARSYILYTSQLSDLALHCMIRTIMNYI